MARDPEQELEREARRILAEEMDRDGPSVIAGPSERVAVRAIVRAMKQVDNAKART